MKLTLRVELTPELKVAIRHLSKRERKQVGSIITAVRDGLGNPHLHSGLGIRRLRSDMFECRVTLKLRLIFIAEAGVLSFIDLATHDEVRRLIKTAR